MSMKRSDGSGVIIKLLRVNSSNLSSKDFCSNWRGKFSSSPFFDGNRSWIQECGIFVAREVFMWSTADLNGLSDETGISTTILNLLKALLLTFPMHEIKEENISKDIPEYKQRVG
jgi:hypothetical protein